MGTHAFSHTMFTLLYINRLLNVSQVHHMSDSEVRVVFDFSKISENYHLLYYVSATDLLINALFM